MSQFWKCFLGVMNYLGALLWKLHKSFMMYLFLWVSLCSPFKESNVCAYIFKMYICSRHILDKYYMCTYGITKYKDAFKNYFFFTLKYPLTCGSRDDCSLFFNVYLTESSMDDKVVKASLQQSVSFMIN